MCWAGNPAQKVTRALQDGVDMGPNLNINVLVDPQVLK